MCRVLSYLGQPILLEELLFKPDNALVRQSYNPKQIRMLNLAGFGFISWLTTINNKPHWYRNHNLPFYDHNLRNLASVVEANCVLAHVRGVEVSAKYIISDQNVHPFKFENSSIAFAHNGTLVGYSSIRFDMLRYTKKKYKEHIVGTTDTEGIYALFLSQLTTRDHDHTISSVFSALIETLKILKKIRKKHYLAIASPLNFFITNGKFIVATRFVFDYGHYERDEETSPHDTYHSLWYTFGEKYGFYENNYQMIAGKKRKSIIISSEPLTKDTTTWIEMPEYSFMGTSLINNEVMIDSLDVMI